MLLLSGWGPSSLWWWKFTEVSHGIYSAFLYYEASVVTLLVLFYLYSTFYPKVFLKSLARE